MPNVYIESTNMRYRNGALRYPMAFRRNQLRVQRLGGHSVKGSRHLAIKDGQFSQADEPISPIRKQKPHHSRANSLASLNGIATTRRIETVSGR